MKEVSTISKRKSRSRPQNRRQQPRPVNKGYGDAGASWHKKATKGFRAMSGSPKEDIDANNYTLRQRARMLYMAAPIATSAIRTNRTNVVGIGLQLKSRIDREALGMTQEAADAWQAQAEREFALWSENKRACDATGVNNFAAMQQLALSSWLVSGDVFAVVKQYEPTPLTPYADALRLLCQPERSAGAGCTYSLMYYEKQGRYHAKDPKPGDQIFFSTAHSKSNVSHTGLVEKVDGSKVYTIEGNTSDQVARRSYYLSDSYIVGYGRPAYDAEPGNTNTGSQTPSGGTTSEVTYTVVAGDTLSKIAAKYGTTYQKLAAYNGITNPNIIRVGQKIKIPRTAAPKKTNAEIAKEVIAGKWGNGTDRKKRLEAAGYDYNAVQQAVNAALAR